MYLTHIISDPVSSVAQVTKKLQSIYVHLLKDKDQGVSLNDQFLLVDQFLLYKDQGLVVQEFPSHFTFNLTFGK